jgi:microcin C transport system permease protein
MASYIFRRLLLMLPTLFGIVLVSFIIIQFVPGGPVERMIAQLQGHGGDATSRFTGGGSDITNNMQSAVGQSSKYRGAQGLDPEFIKELEALYGFDKPAHERFFIMLKITRGSISAKAITATPASSASCWKKCRCRFRSGCGRR